MVIAVVAIAALIFIIYWAIVFSVYEQSTYHKITRLPYLAMRLDLGRFGEYLTYKNLKPFEKAGAKFLFNCYLPSEDKTTEIDVIMIYKSGIYVFESKNYSGWIFGDENHKNWTQTLPQGKGSKKEYFFNPVWQNKRHIQCLKNIVDNEVPVHSLIVFSERCTLKKIEVNSNIAVLKRNSVAQEASKINNMYKDVLTTANVEEFYDRLYPYTQVGEDVKKQHIENIK